MMKKLGIFAGLIMKNLSGKYDEIYEKQCEEAGVEPSPHNKWLDLG